MRNKWILIILMVCLLIGGCKSVGKTEENPVVIAINGEEVFLREWNFFIRMNQMQWEKDYLELYGDEMWSIEGDEEGTTLADNLKKQTLETICKIHLINQHKEEYSVDLDEEKKQEIQKRSKEFMENYHKALLKFAGADEEFVYQKLYEKELSLQVMEAAVADYDPGLTDEEIHREGICYVLISTTGLWDDDGNFQAFSDEEIERRTNLAKELCTKARQSKDLKKSAEEEGLNPIESSMGLDNENDGQEPLMLDAARQLAVGEISEPIETKEGWFVVQHVNDYDEEAVAYRKELLTNLAKEEKAEELYNSWKEEAEITTYQDKMDEVEVKIVLKELL